MSEFDPYHKWLGIPPEDQPPDHYRLLAIKPFEDDPDVIAAAADQRMAHLRTYQIGKYGELSQRLLNEVAVAKVCLLDPKKKAAYDKQLRSTQSQTDTAARPLPVAQAVAAAPVGNPAVDGPTPSIAMGGTVPSSVPVVGSRRIRRRRAVGWQVGAVIAGIGVVLILLLSMGPDDGEDQAKAPASESNGSQPESPVQTDHAGDGATEPVRNEPAEPALQSEPATIPKRETREPTTAPAEPPNDHPAESSEIPDKVAPENLAEKVAAVEQDVAGATSKEALRSIAGQSLVHADQAVVSHDQGNARRSAALALVAARRARAHDLAAACVLRLVELEQEIADAAVREARTRLNADRPLTQSVVYLPSGSDQLTLFDSVGACDWLNILNTPSDLSYWHGGSVKAANGGVEIADTSIFFTIHAKDIAIRVKFKRRSAERVHLRLLTDQGTSYNFGVVDNGRRAALSKWLNAEKRGISLAEEVNVAIPPDKFSELMFTAINGELRGQVNGREVIKARDPGFAIMGVGLSTLRGASLFRDAEVKVLRTQRTQVQTMADRLPVPDEEAQQRGMVLLHEAYSPSQIQNASSGENVRLARTMLSKAKESGDSTERYLLLHTAKELAAQVGDASTAVGALDVMGSQFVIDAPSMKCRTLLQVTKTARSELEWGLLANETLCLAEELVASDAPEKAGELIQAVLAEARHEHQTELVKRLVQCGRIVDEIAEQHKPVVAALGTLESTPTDPAVNLLAGRYYCFVKGDWEQGLPMLALGNDDKLKKMALEELRGVSAAAAQAALGDGWWDLAEGLEGCSRLQVLHRAAAWYGAAVEGLPNGLEKEKVTTRLREVHEAGDGTTVASPDALLSTDSPDRRTPSPKMPGNLILHLNFEPEMFVRREDKQFVKDASGHDSSSEVIGAIQAEGKQGKGLHFDGKWDRVILPDFSRLGAFTFAVWVKPEEKNDMLTILSSRAEGVPGSGLQLHINEYQSENRVFQLTIPQAPTATKAPYIRRKVVSDERLIRWGEWQHLVFVMQFNPNRAVLYHNGRRVAQRDNLIAPLRAPGAWRLGDNLARVFDFSGDMDEVMFFDRALSDEEVRSVYEMGLGRSPR